MEVEAGGRNFLSPPASQASPGGSEASAPVPGLQRGCDVAAGTLTPPL